MTRDVGPARAYPGGRTSDPGGGRVEERDALQAFLPRAVSALLAEAAAGRPAERVDEVDGTLLFADVSGFTRLSERLARRGRAGAEEMVGAVSTVFEPLVGVVHAVGGDVLKFGGDALLVLFRGEGHELRGARAAVGMRRALRAVGSIGTSSGAVRLSMSQGLHAGRFAVVHAGSGGYRDVVVVGADATTTFALEQAAAAGEVLVSPAVVAALAGVPGVVVGPHPGGGSLLLGAGRAPALEHPHEAATPAVVDRVALERYVPPTLRGRLAEVVAESEHRTVSVGFVQYDGCDRLLAEEGPAALLARLDELVDATAAAAGRHSVTVVCMDVGPDGGKVMLTAGAPDSDEQDAASLVRCCLELVAAVPSMRLRAGVNRGGAYAGLVGARERFTYSTMGDAVNVAARLSARAAPGQVVAGEALLDRLPPGSEVSALPPFVLRGKSQPVRAGLVAGVRDDGPGVQVSPLTGRHEELAVLGAAVARARDGEGGLVEVVGAAGVGKTRLLLRLREELDPAELLHVRCERHDRARAHAVSRKLLRALLAVPAAADAATAGARLLGWLDARAPHLRPVAPLVAAAMDADVPPTATVDAIAPQFRVPRLHDAVTEVLGLAAPGFAVVLLEEVGHLDEASRGVLVAALRDVRHRSWLVVTARRPDEDGLADAVRGAGAAGGDAAGGGEAAVTDLDLQPLSLAESVALAQAATSGDVLSRADVDRLVERSGGNPLFLLELVRAFRATGGEQLPGSVESVLAARVDRLPPTRRRLLRYSAVLGEHVDPGLLTRALAGSEPGTAVHQTWTTASDPRSWRELVPLLVPESGGTLRFEHSMLRLVAYDALPFARRRELHARTARALEADGSRDLALLAQHVSIAGDLPRCWRYAVAAGDEARGRFAPGEAADLYELAVRAGTAWDEVDPDRLAATAELLGDTAELAGRYAQAAEAYAVARRYARPADVPRLLARTGRLAQRMGRYPVALGWFSRGLRAAQVLEPAVSRAARVQLLVGRAGVRLLQGRYELAVAACREAVAVADPERDRADLAHAWSLLDAALTDLGRLDEATVWRELALPVFVSLGDTVREADVLNNLGIDAYYEDRLDEAVRVLRAQPRRPHPCRRRRRGRDGRQQHRRGAVRPGTAERGRGAARRGPGRVDPRRLPDRGGPGHEQPRPAADPAGPRRGGPRPARAGGGRLPPAAGRGARGRGGVAGGRGAARGGPRRRRARAGRGPAGPAGVGARRRPGGRRAGRGAGAGAGGRAGLTRSAVAGVAPGQAPGARRSVPTVSSSCRAARRPASTMTSIWWNSSSPTPSVGGVTTNAPSDSASAVAPPLPMSMVRMSVSPSAGTRGGRGGGGGVPGRPAAAGRQVDRDDGSLPPLGERAHGEVVQHAAVDEDALSLHDRREQGRQRVRRGDRLQQGPAAVDHALAPDQVGAHAAEVPGQLLDLRVAVAPSGGGPQPGAAGQRGRRQGPVAERAAADELLVDDRLQRRPVVAQRVAGRDQGPDARPGDAVDDDARLLQLAQDAHVREGPRPAAGHDDPDGAPRRPRRQGSQRGVEGAGVRRGDGRDPPRVQARDPGGGPGRVGRAGDHEVRQGLDAGQVEGTGLRVAGDHGHGEVGLAHAEPPPGRVVGRAARRGRDEEHPVGVPLGPLEPLRADLTGAGDAEPAVEPPAEGGRHRLDRGAGGQADDGHDHRLRRPRVARGPRRGAGSPAWCSGRRGRRGRRPWRAGTRPG